MDEETDYEDDKEYIDVGILDREDWVEVEYDKEVM